MENMIGMLKNSLKNESAFRFADWHVVPVDTRDIGKSAAACLANAENHQNFEIFF
jgi:hypothetical protein